ncbi:MAG TPA: acetylornithine transaminase, partial [Thermodesulfobacteriota bacterium]|nr:acetylornithine transaminase [Thermodesulfobacteriota bacterium]
MTQQELIALGDRVLAPTYARQPVVLVGGEGCRVWDADGRSYLDFAAGIAVVLLGHGHPAMLRAIREQAARLVHVSNLYYIEPQIRLAERLVACSFADRVFFCNSGAEANEAAIKLARRYAHAAGRPGRFHVLSAHGSFHGRTLATLAATGQPKYHRGFEPLPEGFRQVPYGDLAALAAAMDDRVCAVLLEPVQAEGGVRLPPEGYLAAVRRLCDERGVLFILDEVQTGMGRTGRLWAYEHAGVAPDIMTVAKGLAGGVPIGAMLAREAVAAAFEPGSHASTFGGNPLATAVGLAVLEAVLAEGLVERAAEVGGYLLRQLRELAARHPAVAREARGLGLLVGLELHEGAGLTANDLVRQLLADGFLVTAAGPQVLRLVPPLTIPHEAVDRLIEALDRRLAAAAQARPA